MIKYIIIIIIIILIIISIYFIMTKPSPNLHREILRTASGLNKLRNKFIRSAKKIVNVSVRSKEPSLKSLDDFARIFLGYGGVFKIAARMGTLSARELSVKLDILPEDLRKWLHEALINGILEKTRTPHGFIKYTINITAVRTALVKLFNNITRLFSIEEISGEAVELSYDDAFDFLRKFLSLILPLKENLISLLHKEAFNNQDFLQFGFSELMINRWLNEALEIGLIERISENNYRFNTENLPNILLRLKTSINVILDSIKTQLNEHN